MRDLLIGGAIIYALSVADSIFGHKPPPPPPGGDVDPAGGGDNPNQGDPRPATLTQAQAGQIADGIKDAVWGGGLIASPWENDEQFGALLMQCQVSNDVNLLMNAYGVYGQVLSPMNLSQTVTEYLDGDVKAVVNADYDAKGIIYNWN